MKWSVKQRLDSAYLSTPLGVGFTVCRTGDTWRCYVRDITGLTAIGTATRDEYPEIADVLPWFTSAAGEWLIGHSNRALGLAHEALKYAKEIDNG